MHRPARMVRMLSLIPLVLGLAACSESKDEPMVAVDCAVYVEAVYPEAGNKPVVGMWMTVDAHKSDLDGHPIAGTELATGCTTDDKGTCTARFGYNLGGTQRQWAVVWVSMVVRGVKVEERVVFTVDDAPGKTKAVRLVAAP